jgi:Oxidoreductase family, NAD-binding Rossmann fold
MSDPKKRMPDDPSRRDFLRAGVAAGLAAAVRPERAAAQTAASPAGTTLFAAPPMERVRIGYVGVGERGAFHVDSLLRIEGAEIRAVCDIVPEKVAAAQERVKAAGQPAPAGYSRGERDFERMCDEQELDLVYNATPWEWHVPICLAAMRTGKHAATEVPAAVTVEECWQLVEAAEKHQRHCVMMENCCYDRREMLTLVLVRRGLLGEVLHGECAYLHDLRAIKFARESEGLWRRAHSERRNGNLYPTHGLGPVAQCMDVNRGNRFDYLVSMSGNSRGLQRWAAEHLAADDPRRKETYKLGDVNTTLIRTVNGQTIFLSHDTNSPRPYSRIGLVQGTRGLVQGWPDRVYLEGRSPNDEWEPAKKYYKEFEHPLWRPKRVRDDKSGHGGMDYLVNQRLVECLRRGLPTDQNVYDAAAWSAISGLTERSVAEGSRPVEVPDFTRGRWKTTPPLGIVGEGG